MIYIYLYEYIYILDSINSTCGIFTIPHRKQVQGLGGTFFPTSGGFDGDSPP